MSGRASRSRLSFFGSRRRFRQSRLPKPLASIGVLSLLALAAAVIAVTERRRFLDVLGGLLDPTDGWT